MPIDYADYPDDWHELSAEIRFERAAGRCECRGECGLDHAGRCECKHGAANPRTGSEVVLTTAHLDHDKQNSDPDNLRAMCQQCHLRYDHDHHMINSLQTRMERAGQLAFTWAFRRRR